LLPIAVCVLLWRREIDDPAHRRIVFAAASVLAWGSLVQFPYSSAIYFCYVAPLALIGAILVSDTAPRLRGIDGRPLAALLILFAVLSMNRGTIDLLGQIHAAVPMQTPLDVPRAHLVLTAGDVQAVRRMVSLVNQHLGSGELVAGPDCPEVYFLAGRVNPSGALFDALTDSGVDVSGSGPSWIGPETSVLVLNHRPEFSEPPARSYLDAVRRDFPHGDMAGWYEVRWR
jgi:hypothetical protein